MDINIYLQIFFRSILVKFTQIFDMRENKIY